MSITSVHASIQSSIQSESQSPKLEKIHLVSFNLCPSLAFFEGLPKISAWTECLLERPSVNKSTVDGIEDIFLDYLAGKGSPTRNVAPSWLADLIK